MAIIRTTPLYLGRQFTQGDANPLDPADAIDTSGRVIVYNDTPKFYCRAWDDGGHGEDIWFEVHIYQRSLNPAPPPTYQYLVPVGSTFRVNSVDDSVYFHNKQYYKSGETCVIDYSLLVLATCRLTTYSGASNIFAIQWVAYDRTSSTPLATQVIEFTYITSDRLASLENLDPTVFDRVTIFRPDGAAGWVEVEAPLIPLSVPFKEPFESAAKTLSMSFTDEWGIFLPQSEDDLNYVGTAATGIYSPVFRLGNRVAYEQGIIIGNPITFGWPGWTNLITYTDPSRYRNRVWILPGALRKTPWLRQNINIQYRDGAAWVDAVEGDDYDIFQYGVFFRDAQTNVRARGSYHNVRWDYFGMFYMGAPNYSNAPSAGNVVTVDCQDRLSLIDSNGRVYLATCEVQAFADLDEHKEKSFEVGVGALPGFYCNNDYLKTWQDPTLPDGLLLWFYDLNGPYVGNYAGIDPIADGSAAVWNDEFEIFIEYEDPNPFHVNEMNQVDEDAYIRTMYGILINKDWSADLPWQHTEMQLTFQTFVPNSNPVNAIFQQILAYPNYEPATKRYGGPGLELSDYSIPGITDSSDIDDWMCLDVNRFIWNHYNGSAFDAIKELMRIAGFPYNYRVTSEPNPLWGADPFNPNYQDIITFREVSQYPIEFAETMLMLPINVKQKIEEDKTATIVRTRVFDDFASDLGMKSGVVARLCWGPGNSTGWGWPYKGGYNRNGGQLFPDGPSMAPTSTHMKIIRGGIDNSADLEVDISDSWRAGLADQNARGILTDSNMFTHLNHYNDSRDWNWWFNFIATPLVELVIPATILIGGVPIANDPIDLAAIDFRNQETRNYMEYGEWGSNQHIGIRYGTIADRTNVTGVTCFGTANIIRWVPPGAYETNELVGAVLEIDIGGAVNPQDIGNTYPIIANDGPLGTITVEIRDFAYFNSYGWGTLEQQLGILGCVNFNIIIRNYKWLPNFNRKITPIQSTTSWEVDGYAIEDVRYLEIWCIKPGAASRARPVSGDTPAYNDQFIDIGNIYIYDKSATIGKPAWMRIRDSIGEVPDESEDTVENNDEFFRQDLVNRLGMRTNVLADDKSLVDFDYAFERAGQALYENLVVEDTYEIDGIYFPHIPRFSTVLINIESMEIAFPALVESRSCTFAGTERSYRWVLRNYNNLIWPHPHEAEYDSGAGNGGGVPH